MKKVLWSGLSYFLLATSVFAANAGWQAARIVSVSQSSETKSTVQGGSAPLTQEETVYVITVHVRDKIVTGSYAPGKGHRAPPGNWTKDHPVQAQLAGDYLYVRSSLSDEVRAQVSKSKPAPPVRPWTPEESDALNASMAPPQKPDSMVGFDVPTTKTATPAATPAAVAGEAPSPPEPMTGSVSVSSVPYLAEMFVDGESMGYTPAKLRLPAGKHSFRCEKTGYKPWTKEITITAGSDLSLDAMLPANKK